LHDLNHRFGVGMVRKSLGIENPSFRACLMLQGETPVGSQDLLVAGFVFVEHGHRHSYQK